MDTQHGSLKPPLQTRQVCEFEALLEIYRVAGYARPDDIPAKLYFKESSELPETISPDHFEWRVFPASPAPTLLTPQAASYACFRAPRNAAMSVAAHIRDAGRNVLFLAESITRFAEAHREVAAAGGAGVARVWGTCAQFRAEMHASGRLRGKGHVHYYAPDKDPVKRLQVLIDADQSDIYLISLK